MTLHLKPMTAREQAVLVEAYHVAYDHDEQVRSLPFSAQMEIGDDARNMRNAIATMMRLHGVTVPPRFDGDGRTAENGGL